MGAQLSTVSDAAALGVPSSGAGLLPPPVGLAARGPALQWPVQSSVPGTALVWLYICIAPLYIGSGAGGCRAPGAACRAAPHPRRHKALAQATGWGAADSKPLTGPAPSRLFLALRPGPASKWQRHNRSGLYLAGGRGAQRHSLACVGKILPSDPLRSTSAQRRHHRR